MIKRIPGSIPTRSKTVIHNGLVYTVTTAPTKSAPLYGQTKEALAIIDRSLADAGVAVTVLPTTDLFLMGRNRDHSVVRGVADANLLIELKSLGRASATPSVPMQHALRHQTIKLPTIRNATMPLDSIDPI